MQGFFAALYALFGAFSSFSFSPLESLLFATTPSFSHFQLCTNMIALSLSRRVGENTAIHSCHWPRSGIYTLHPFTDVYALPVKYRFFVFFFSSLKHYADDISTTFFI